MGNAISGVAQAGASVAAAVVQANAAKEAAAKQLEFGREALAQQKDVYDTTRGDFDPYRQFGQQALDPLGQLLYGSPDLQANLEATPGYQFALSQGVRAQDAGASNSGLVNSGARAKALTEYGQGLAGQTLTQERAALFNAADTGLNAAAQQGVAGRNFANASGTINQNIGDGLASAAVARGNAYSGLATNLADAFGSIIGGL